MMARSMRLKRQIDRRALLQRARRSPIRPRSSRAEERARAVSPAKDGRTERMFEREAMNHAYTRVAYRGQVGDGAF
jgi:hypothetical protein